LKSIGEYYAGALVGAVGAQFLPGEEATISIFGDEPVPPGWNENWIYEPGTRYGASSSPMSWFDEDGGEWVWHQNNVEPSHWNYNPWTSYNSNWTNVP
jgi:hypothetical protein